MVLQTSGLAAKTSLVAVVAARYCSKSTTERHDMAEGKVKWFNPDKGYGFIARDEGEDLFVHYSEIQGDGFKTLEENADVEFDITTGREGKLQASNVRLVN